MSRQFKFNYVYEITGAFVFIALSLFFLSIFFTARVQGWFEPAITFHTLFSTNEGAFGLEQGSNIIIMNTRAGHISSIAPNKQGFLEAELKIKQTFHKFVLEDSIVVVKKKFALAGDAYIEIISTDFSKPVLKEYSYLKSSKDTEIMETVNDVLDDVREQLMPTLEKLKIALEGLPDLENQTIQTLKEAELFLKELRKDAIPAITDIRNFAKNSPEFSEKLKNILKNFDEILIKLDKDKSLLFTNINETFHTGKNTLTSFDNILKEVDKKDISKFVSDLPMVTSNIINNLDALENIMIGLKKHWLLKKYVNEKKSENNISPFFDGQVPHE